MLATQCSFCKHENTPGARFCAECGSPLHLKVCPNPGCGKVSEASASVCATCGVPFPPIKLVEPGSLGAEAAANAARSHAEPGDKPRTSVWPLIAVAVVAGSLPLLWANRAHLPAPKSGPFSTPDITTPAPAPVPAASPAPSKVATPAVARSVAPPATAAPVPPPTGPTAAAPSAGELDPAGPAATAAPAKTEKKAPPRKPKSTVAQKSAKAPGQPAEPPPTCTEAVAALGLCDPKQVGK